MGTTKNSAGGSRPVTKADLELDDPKRNMALVIKRMKQIAKEDTNRFEKMGMSETLARLEQSEKVAASVEAAHATEMTRKRALLSAFVASGTTPPAPATRGETPTQNVSTNVAKTATANDGDAAPSKAPSGARGGQAVSLPGNGAAARCVDWHPTRSAVLAGCVDGTSMLTTLEMSASEG